MTGAFGRRSGLRHAAWILALFVSAVPTHTASGADAPPARASLLPLARPLWSDLTAAQREVLAELEPEWPALPSERKRAWIALADRIPRMASAERETALARIRIWARLTPEQRRQARYNYRIAQTLPKEARTASWEQYQQMTPEQQSVLRSNGWTSNTAARHAGAPTGLAKEAARPMPGVVPRAPVIPPVPQIEDKPAAELSRTTEAEEPALYESTPDDAERRGSPQ